MSWRRLTNSSDSLDISDDGTTVRLLEGQRPPVEFSYSFIDELREAEHYKSLFPDTTLKSCRDLGLWDAENECVRHEWHVEQNSMASLNKFPERLPHAGNYSWIGEQVHEPPKWLWDSYSQRTIRTNAEILQAGYIAISYTWGRWALQKEDWDKGKRRWVRRKVMRHVGGVGWQIPAVKSSCGDIIHLLPMLSKIPDNRYYWIDVLCINQEDNEEATRERDQEVAKQGSIFTEARAVIVYTWSVSNGDQLARTLCNLGDSLLWSLRLPPRNIFGGTTATYSGRKPLNPSSFRNAFRDSTPAQAF